MTRSGCGIGKGLLEAGLIALALLFLFPFYLTLVNGMKPYDEMARSLLAFPRAPELKNFAAVWEKLNYPRSFLNSLSVTAASVAGILLASAACAYQLVRRPGRISSAIFYSILASMIIPFQTVMVPLVVVAKELGLVDTLHGVILIYCGFSLPMAVFLYHGFIKAIPRELEEAAHIDGSGTFGTFFRIVFPLLKPVTASVAVINALGIWNDFMVPLLMISSESLRTIPLASSIFYGVYKSDWNLAMAALTLGMLPVVVFFLFMQRFIVQGIVAGAVKT